MLVPPCGGRPKVRNAPKQNEFCRLKEVNSQRGRCYSLSAASFTILYRRQNFNFANYRIIEESSKTGKCAAFARLAAFFFLNYTEVVASSSSAARLSARNCKTLTPGTDIPILAAV